MADDRSFYQGSLRFTGFFIFSLSFGIMVTLIASNIENLVQEKRIKEEARKEISEVAASFKASVRGAAPEQTIAFLKGYIAMVGRDKFVAVDPVETNLRPVDAKYLRTVSEGPLKLAIFIKKSYLSKTAHAIDPPDLIDGFVVTIVVLASLILYSERKRQTQEIKQRYETKTEELTKALQKHEALALLGRMTATLAHELKTPIATISTLVQVLPARITDEKFTKRFVAITKEELQRTQQLIDNLLVYGKEISETNDEWIELEPFVRELADANGINLSVCPGIDINGDRFYLRLLFDNILRNSLQAGAGNVFMKAEKPAAEDSAVGLFFEDNGAGFPKDADLAELLNPFVTSRSRGAGLGLFLVQKIALAHGGTISLYNTGAGAGVKLTFPSKRIMFHG
ncbi:MAG: HAMP domain-containing histidine kinase [Deltaproteobacteria bacterium]|nr:HAMP domain-containing histidine kinase [Deltaproteobacteria bacterium]